MSPLLLTIIVIALVLLAGVIVLLMFIAYLRRRISKTVRKTLLFAWNKAVVERHPTLKIVQADKILDEALSQRGFTGSLGDKLKAAETLFTDINAVWKAHKLRNTLVHDLQAEANDRDVDDAMRAFRQALRDVGV
ncbi:MAG: hypothetical protein ABL890_00805 [Candidatus Peribacteraceae bacterium]